MTVRTDTSGATTGVSEQLPNRLHHAAWVTLDSEATRQFYEDVLGIPLVATWCESINGSDYMHTFYSMRDGGAVAFFEYADDDRRGIELSSPGHLAFECDEVTQLEIEARLESHGYSPRVTDHGYCKSLYITDPNNLRLEFTVDHPDATRINSRQLENCHDDLRRWLAGDHTPNNDIRAH